MFWYFLDIFLFDFTTPTSRILATNAMNSRTLAMNAMGSRTIASFVTDSRTLSF